MAAEASESLQPELRWLQSLIEDHPLVIESAKAHICASGAHSHTRDGRIVCWAPGVESIQVAVDAEAVEQPVPGLLARRWRCAEPDLFWTLWTATEVASKLVNTPILAWISTSSPVRASPCSVAGGTVWWLSGITHGLRISYGFLSLNDRSVPPEPR